MDFLNYGNSICGPIPDTPDVDCTCGKRVSVDNFEFEFAQGFNICPHCGEVYDEWFELADEDSYEFVDGNLKKTI